MSKSVERIKQRAVQIANWRLDNQIGFDIWRTVHTYSTGSKSIALELACVQCKYGIYILQVNQEDNTWLVYKCNEDLSLK